MSLAAAGDVSLSHLPLLASKHWITAGVIFPKSNPLQSGGSLVLVGMDVQLKLISATPWG